MRGHGHASAGVPFPKPRRLRTSRLGAQHRIPAIYGNSEAVIEGGLIGYAASVTENFRKAASFVARVLNGAKPKDLPIGQPTRV